MRRVLINGIQVIQMCLVTLHVIRTITWVVLNGVVFWNTYRSYKGQTQYYYIYEMLGSGLCISRGSGAVLNLNCAVILVPACKHLVTLMHRQCGKLPGKSLPRLAHGILNQMERIHAVCAITVLVASGAHVANVINFSLNYNSKWSEVNMADYRGQNPLEIVTKTIAGVTGVLMTALLIAMSLTSMRWFRKRYYNAFYNIHNLCFFPFLVLLIFHPVGGNLKEVVNWREHQPGKNSTFQTETSPPVFESIKTYTWIWITVPLSLYAIDWGYRKYIRRNPAVMLHSIMHEDEVLEIAFSHSLDKYPKPGQFVMLQCPRISSFEWHPFTVSCCNDKNYSMWTIHVKLVGDWSRRLADVLLDFDACLVDLYVDGPFTSPLVDVIHHKIVVCIAVGVGLTPFLSLIYYLARNGWSKLPNQLHVLWCVRKVESISWACEAINQLIEDAWASPRPEKLEMKIHVTRCPSEATCTPLQVKLQETYPNVYRRIEYGRPDWSQTFDRWKELHKRELVNVFTCGPDSLNEEVQTVCRRYSNFQFTCEKF